MQDVHCVRCKRMKTSNLASYCQCSGAWQHKMSPEDTMRRLQQARAIAEFHAFPLLHATLAHHLAVI